MNSALGRAPHGAHWEDLAVQRGVRAIAAAAAALASTVCCGLSLQQLCRINVRPCIHIRGPTYRTPAGNEDYNAEPAAFMARRKALLLLHQQATAWAYPHTKQSCQLRYDSALKVELLTDTGGGAPNS